MGCRERERVWLDVGLGESYRVGVRRLGEREGG